MSGSTNYAARAWLDGKAMPRTLYLQHHTADPGPDGTANPSSLPRIATGFKAVDERSATNTAEVLGTLAAAETLSHWSLWDRQAGGHAWWVGEWARPRTYEVGDSPRVNPGDLVLSLL